MCGSTVIAGGIVSNSIELTGSNPGGLSSVGGVLILSGDLNLFAFVLIAFEKKEL